MLFLFLHSIVQQYNITANLGVSFKSHHVLSLCLTCQDIALYRWRTSHDFLNFALKCPPPVNAARGDRPSRPLTRRHCVSDNVGLIAYMARTSVDFFCPNAYTRWGLITGPRTYKRHNLVNIRFIYVKISDNIAEGMLSLQIWKNGLFVKCSLLAAV